MLLLLLILQAVDGQTVSEVADSPVVNSCAQHRCSPGTFWVVETDFDTPYALCRECPNGTVYKSCPNCMEARTCVKKDTTLNCQQGCYPSRCVCPPGLLLNPCEVCVKEEDCPGPDEDFICVHEEEPPQEPKEEGQSGEHF